VGRIRQCDRVQELDVDGMAAATIEQTEEAVCKLHDGLMKRLEHVGRDGALDHTARDLLTSCYRDAIASVVDLHGNLADLRWAILEHDADLSPRTGKTFTDVNALLAELRG